MAAIRVRKKPVEVQAFQYRESERDDLIKWIENGGGEVIHTGIDDDGAKYELASPRIKTLEGEMRVELGDWVIKGVLGEFYPCKPAIFNATYVDA